MQHNQTDPFLTTWNDIDGYIEFLSNQDGQALIDAYYDQQKGGNN